MPVNEQEQTTNLNGHKPDQPGEQQDEGNNPKNAKQDGAKQGDEQNKDKKDDAEKKPLDPATKH